LSIAFYANRRTNRFGRVLNAYVSTRKERTGFNIDSCILGSEPKTESGYADAFLQCFPQRCIIRDEKTELAVDESQCIKGFGYCQPLS
jgi:hypothetical protein